MTVRFFSHVSPSFLSCLFVVGLLCAAPNASAQGGATTSETATTRTSAIPAASGQLLHNVPEVVQDSLPNGVRILFARVNELPLVEINIIIDAGLSLEHSDARGSAWALAQLLTGGNRERTGEMVTTYLAEMGSTVVPYAHYDYTQLYGRTLSRNFPGTLEIMADGVIAPSLREQELMVLQRNSSTRLQRRVSSGERATVAAVRSLCGEEHVLTRYMLPAPEDIAALTTAQLTDFHAKWYRPSRTTVIVTGSVDYRFVRTAIIEAFGGWQPTAEGPSLRASIEAPDILKGGAQELVRLLPEDKTPNGLAYFRFGVRAPLRGDDRFVATILLNTILGEGPESRLRRMFWGRHTISPTFTAAVAFSQDCSYFMISGSATPLMADSVFTFAHETVSEIVKEGVTEEELGVAKSQLLSNELLTFASNRNMQSLLKESVVYRIPFKKMLGFTDRLRAVTTEDVRRVAADLFEPGRWTQVTLGSATKLRPVIEASGRKVVILEDDRPKDDGERDAGENEQEK